MISVRFESDVARQAGNAALAAATAASTSAIDAKSTSRAIWPVAGLKTGPRRPEVPATRRPPIQCGTMSVSVDERAISGSERRSEIPAPDYDVVVFENRFPSLGPDLGQLPEQPAWGTRVPAYGRCEVVSFTPDHTGSFAGLGEARARTVVEAWAVRTAVLSALPGIRQVFPFENRGAEIGVTLHHPHGQIYAYPYLPPRAAVLAAAARKYYDDAGRRDTLTGSLLRAERTDGSRMVLEGRHFSAYVPFAARWPLEVHLVPHRQVPDLAALHGDERDELAQLYLDLLRRLDALYPTPTPVHRRVAAGTAGYSCCVLPATCTCS